MDSELGEFLQAYIPTVEHLEVLLLVGSSPEHWWSVRAVNDLLRSTEESIASRLKELCDRDLLERERGGEAYRIKENPELLNLLDRLKLTYKSFRVRVIETIYSGRGSAISEFSRAFEIKRPKKG